MGGGSTNGRPVPSNDVPEWGVASISTANEENRLVDIGQETDTVAIRANPNNNGLIYVGFGTSLSTSNGYPLEAGDGISVELDTNEQPIYVLGDTVGDDVRYIVLS